MEPSHSEESFILIFFRWDDQGNSTILAEGDQNKVFFLKRTSQLFQGFHLNNPDLQVSPVDSEEGELLIRGPNVFR